MHFVLVFGISLVALFVTSHGYNQTNEALSLFKQNWPESSGSSIWQQVQSSAEHQPIGRRHLTQTSSYSSVIITAGPKNASYLNSDNIAVLFSVGASIVRVQCIVLRQPGEVVLNIVPCTSPLTLTNRLSEDGLHLVSVGGYTQFSDDPILDTRFWWMDRLPPTTEIINAVAVGPRSIRFTFNGKDINGGVTRFYCSLNNQAFVRCRSPHTITVSTLGTHSFRVGAQDRAGNTDPFPATHFFGVTETSIIAADSSSFSSSSSSQQDNSDGFGSVGTANTLDSSRSAGRSNDDSGGGGTNVVIIIVAVVVPCVVVIAIVLGLYLTKNISHRRRLQHVAQFAG